VEKGLQGLIMKQKPEEIIAKIVFRDKRMQQVLFGGLIDRDLDIARVQFRV